MCVLIYITGVCKFSEIPGATSKLQAPEWCKEVVLCRRTNRHEEANSRYSQIFL